MYIPLACVIWNLLTTTLISGYDDLSAHRSATQFRTWVNCPTCVANNAVDRDISTCANSEMGQTSDDKYTWWNVDLGAVHSVYNIRIQFRDYGQINVGRQKGRFAGFSLYVSNTTDRHDGYLCYKDGPELPPLDFNTNCTVHGRYVIFYNERLIGTQYPPGYEIGNVITELCEVTVTGCSALDIYGCQIPCPDNCEGRRCDATDGTCIGCTPGWVGEYCQTACRAGYYGKKCESKCVGVCKDKEPCNYTNGLCDKGCDAGWTGTNCTEECSTGNFGSDCIFSCSGHCLDDITCNRTTGKCDTGCKPGYTGDLCDKGCENGLFGTDCSKHCSGNCIYNVSCNSTNGHCNGGCASGYLDVFCNKTDVQSNVFNNDCNDTFYIAGLSILAIITILISMLCLLFIRKYHRLVKIVRSLPYTSITKTSPGQGNNIIDGQHYEELRISENSYHNTELKN